MEKYVILDTENNIIGVTNCDRVRELTTNRVVEVEDCPEDTVGSAKLIDGEVVYNDPS